MRNNMAFSMWTVMGISPDSLGINPMVVPLPTFAAARHWVQAPTYTQLVQVLTSRFYTAIFVDASLLNQTYARFTQRLKLKKLF